MLNRTTTVKGAFFALALLASACATSPPTSPAPVDFSGLGVLHVRVRPHFPFGVHPLTALEVKIDGIALSDWTSPLEPLKNYDVSINIGNASVDSAGAWQSVRSIIKFKLVVAKSDPNNRPRITIDIFPVDTANAGAGVRYEVTTTDTPGNSKLNQDTNGKRLSFFFPRLPKDASTLFPHIYQLSIHLSICIDRDGKVDSAEILLPSASPEWDKNVLNSIFIRRYKPATEKGIAFAFCHVETLQARL